MPFVGDTTYRTTFKPYDVAETPGCQVQYGPDEVPTGVDPKTWKDYVAKHGTPPPYVSCCSGCSRLNFDVTDFSGKIPTYLFHRLTPESRDFATENRAEYTPKFLGNGTSKLEYGPNGVPSGVDPMAWKAFVDKYGIPAE